MAELYEYMGTHLPEGVIERRRELHDEWVARTGRGPGSAGLTETFVNLGLALGLTPAQIRGNPNSPSSEGSINKI